MMKSILDKLIIFVIVSESLFSIIYSAPPYTIENGVGSGKQSKGRKSNAIKKTYNGLNKQILKLERFVDLHKDINSLNFDPITKSRRTKALGEARERLDHLYQRQSIKKDIQKSRPGLNGTTYSSLTTKAMKQSQSSASSSKSSNVKQSPQSSKGSNTSAKVAKESPDSIMGRHLGGWKIPEGHNVAAH